MKKLAYFFLVATAVFVSMVLIGLLLIARGIPLQSLALDTGDRGAENTISQSFAAETVTSVPTPRGTPKPSTRTPAPDELRTSPETLEPPGGSPEPYTPPATLTPLPALPSEKREGLWTENLVFSEPEIFAPNITDVWQIVPSPEGNALAVTFHNGKTFATTVSDPNFSAPIQITLLLSSIAILNVESQAIVTVIDDAHTPRWSPDGTHVAYYTSNGTDPKHIWVLNVQTGETQQAAEFGESAKVGELDWLSERELLFYVNELQIYDLETKSVTSVGTVTSTLDTFTNPSQFSFSPLSKRIVFGSPTTIHVLQRTKNDFELVVKLDEGGTGPIALSPNGRFLAFLRRGEEIQIVDLQDPTKTPVRFGGSSVWIDGWSPDSISLFLTDLCNTQPFMINQDGSGYQPIPVQGKKNTTWLDTGQRVFWITSAGQIATSTVSSK